MRMQTLRRRERQNPRGRRRKRDWRQGRKREAKGKARRR
jgi:hypothetical protein